jgi:hypothetical protein
MKILKVINVLNLASRRGEFAKTLSKTEPKLFSTSIVSRKHDDFEKELARKEMPIAATTKTMLSMNESFKGLAGVSKSVISDILGPEPNYQNLNPDSYKIYKHNEKITFRNGGILPEAQIAYETWGKLNESKSNAILLFTGLSANSHAKSSKV